jgi:hypothetical protein
MAFLVGLVLFVGVVDHLDGRLDWPRTTTAKTEPPRGAVEPALTGRADRRSGEAGLEHLDTSVAPDDEPATPGSGPKCTSATLATSSRTSIVADS